MRRPLFFPLIALIAGILAGDTFSCALIYFAWGGVAALSFLLISVRNRWNMAAFTAILFIIFIIGLAGISRHHHSDVNPEHILQYATSGKITLEGTVLKSEPTSAQKNILLVRCRHILKNRAVHRVKGDIRLSVPPNIIFGYGDYIRFSTSVKKISGFHNPGGFHLEKTFNRQGIFAAGYIAGEADIILIRHQTGNRFLQILSDYRFYLKRLIDDNTTNPENAILEAMMLGNQGNIPQDVRDHFSQTGTAHILSISGLHVGIVASACYLLILLLLKSSEYMMLRFNIMKIAAAGALIPVMLYALLAGMGTPVLRSAIMALAFLLAMMAGRIRDLYNILFGAALIILVIAPEALFEVSFQLSFSAVLSLIYIVPRFSKIKSPIPDSAPLWISSLVRRVYLAALASMAATIGTWPIIIYYFNLVSTVTLIANLICVPLMGMLTLIPALIAMLSAPFSSVAAGALIKIAACFTGIAVNIINRLAALPGSSIHFIRPNLPEMILYYLILLSLVHMLSSSDKKNEADFASRHRVLIKIVLFVCLALLLTDIAYFKITNKISKDLKLTAIDVGQGSSTLVEYPGGVTMLIDGGGSHDGSFDMGKTVIAPFLYFKRIQKIDIAVLTHPHPDHLQGLIYIIDHFDVKEVWTTGVKADDDFYRLWEKTIHARGIKVRQISSQTESIRVSDANVEFLWPPPDVEKKSDEEINDTSLVMKIIFGRNRFLMTGDISSEVESLLIASGKDMKSDLLFVPHHGSVHSSSLEFLRSVSPQFAIVSSGKNNVFRHPHPEVIDRYRSMRATLFRTDQQGAVSVHSNGNVIEIQPFLLQN